VGGGGARVPGVRHRSNGIVFLHRKGYVMDQLSPTMIADALAALGEANTTLAVGVLLMALVFLARRIVGPLVRKDDVPLFTAGLAVVVSVGSALYEGASVWGALATGVLVGATAVGFWELLGKRIKVWVAARADKASGKDAPQG
jgi:hypothetical protein